MSHAFRHIVERCQHCPATIRRKLGKSMSDIKIPEKNRRRFVELIFERVHKLDKSAILKQQEIVENTIAKKSNRRRQGEKKRKRSRQRGRPRKRKTAHKSPDEDMKSTTDNSEVAEMDDVDTPDQGELSGQESELEEDLEPVGTLDLGPMPKITDNLVSGQFLNMKGAISSDALIGDDHMVDIITGDNLISPEHTFENLTNDWDPLH